MHQWLLVDCIAFAVSLLRVLLCYNLNLVPNIGHALTFWQLLPEEAKQANTSEIVQE